MLPNVDKIESLLKEVKYNKDTNTFEVGGNFYVDGYIQPSLSYIFQSGQQIAVYTINTTENAGEMVLVELMDSPDRNFIGFGTRDNSGNYSLMAYLYDNDEVGSLQLIENGSEDIGVDFFPFITTEKSYFEHQLTISTSTESFYINYYSGNNLKIDSLQDLTAVVKPNANTKLGLGSTYLKYENSIWKLANGDLITTVADNVVKVD